MPVSKKRKKDGKPVQRKTETHPGEEHAHGPDAAPAAEAGSRPAMGRPSNPFLAQQRGRGSQRGR